MIHIHVSRAIQLSTCSRSLPDNVGNFAISKNLFHILLLSNLNVMRVEALCLVFSPYEIVFFHASILYSSVISAAIAIRLCPVKY